MSALEGSLAIVTGGGSGIGAHYSAALAESGATVVIADVADSSATQASIESAGGRADVIPTDVSDEDAVRSLVGIVVERYGRIDVLVNNAALFATLPTSPYHEIDVDLWDRVMRVNLRGTFLMCKHVGPVMAAQNRGKIVNVGSGTAIKGMPMMLAYVTSKGGIVALTRTLARELGPSKVCVNTLAPGLTLSDTLVASNPGLVDAAREPTIATRSLKRDSTPADLIGALLFLSSPASDFVTGQTILVDGGQLNT